MIWYFMTETTFPMPAELKPLARKAKRERVTKLSQPATLIAWQCEGLPRRMLWLLPSRLRRAALLPGNPTGPGTDGGADMRREHAGGAQRLTHPQGERAKARLGSMSKRGR